MRYRWYSTITLALATFAVVCLADPAAAQRFRGRGYGWYGGGGYGWYGDGDGYGWRGNWGYPIYSGYQPYTYGYYNYPAYSDYYSNTQPDQGYTSFYSGPTEDQNAARISVVVPPNAQVFFDGEKTNQRGQFRRFVTPALDPGQTYTYDIKAVWDENGKKVERTNKVRVRAGQQSSIDFMAMGGRDMQGTDYNRTDTYDRDRNRDRDLNRDRTDMNRNRNEPAPAPEPKDQNKPPMF